MGKRDIEVAKTGAGVDPESFRFPENQDPKIPSQELDPAELKEILELLNSKDPAVNATAEARISALGFPNSAVFREFNFYQNRFAAMTERHNKRRGIDRLVDKSFENDKATRPKKVTKEYVMQESAERENDDRDRRLDKERREWDKKLKPVIDALKLKRDDPEGEGKKRKVLILSLGGGLKGPYGAGQAIALNEMGITADKADVLVGASAGMADLVYYAAGPEQTYIGTSMYYDECTTPEFLDVRRAVRSEPIMNSKVAAGSMRHGEKAVDQKAIRRLRTEVYALVTPVDGSDVELVDIKTAEPDMIAPIEASMNVRLRNAPGTEVNGREYEDGSFGSLSIQRLIDRFQPTDILVLPQAPFRKMIEFNSKVKTNVIGFPLEKLPNSGVRGVVKKFLSIAKELRNMLEEFKTTEGVNIGVLWPPDAGLDTMDADADLIKYGVVEAARETYRQFGEKQPEKVNLYIPEKFRNHDEVAA